MKNQKVMKKEHSIISGVLIITGIILSTFSAAAKANGPSELIQYGILQMIGGAFTLAGSVVGLLSIIFSKNKQKINVDNCPNCGTVIHSKNDKFCRTCGEFLLS